MTIGLLARKHGLSRSTLLYYDRIGLLRPCGRLGNSYRHYTRADDERLRQICLYRRTGLPLAVIRRILDRPRRDLAAALERQLHDAMVQIDGLRSRQRLIVELLQSRRLLDQVRNLDRQKWVSLLRASGFTDGDMERWHRDFEKSDAKYHQRFLEFLGIPPGEIAALRERSRREATPLAHSPATGTASTQPARSAAHRPRGRANPNRRAAS